MRLGDDRQRRRDRLGRQRPALGRGQPPLDGVEHERQVVVERTQPCRVVLDRLSGSRQERPNVSRLRFPLTLAHP
jgi:hypothetical protein